MNLSYFFTEEMKAKFIERKLTLGTALIIEIPSFNIKHKKFAIIIGVDADDVGLVIINTEINPNVFNTPYLKSQHVCIPVVGHEDFLIVDSHIDCTKIQIKKKKEVIEFIDNNLDKVFSVTQDVCRDINLMITSSKLLSKHDKKRFGFA